MLGKFVLGRDQLGGLSGDISETVSDTLTPSEVFTFLGADPIEFTVPDTLTFTESQTAIGVFPRSFTSDTLTFTESFKLSFNESVSDTLTLTDDQTFLVQKLGTLTDTDIFNGTETELFEYVAVQLVTVSDTLTASETYAVEGPMRVPATDTLTPVEVFVGAGDQSVTVTDNPSFAEKFGQVYEFTVTDSPTLSELIVTPIPTEPVSDSLTLTETRLGVVSTPRSVSDTLTLTETRGVSGPVYASGSDSVAFTEPTMTPGGPIYVTREDAVFNIGSQGPEAPDFAETITGVINALDVTLTVTDSLNLAFANGETFGVVILGSMTVFETVTEEILTFIESRTTTQGSTPGDFMVFVETISIDQVYLETVTDTLILIEDNRIEENSVFDTLDLVETITVGNAYLETFAETLVIIEGGHVEDEILFDALTFTDSATSNDFIYITVTDSATLTDSGVIPAIPQLSDTLTLTDSAKADGPYPETASDTLEPFETISIAGSVTNEVVVDILSATDSATYGPTEFFTDTLTFSENFLNSDPSDVLLPVESFTGLVSPSVFDTFEITEDIIEGFTGSDTVTDTLTPVEGFIGSVQTNPNTKIYAPFGNGPVPTTEPTLVCQDTVTFTYPYVTPTLTVEMKRPLGGNNLVIQQSRINRESRGGTLIICRPQTTWPKTKRQKFQFVALTQATVDAFYDLYQDGLGKEVGYLDYEGRQWRGIIIEPQVVNNRRNCGYDLNFEFEGELA